MALPLLPILGGAAALLFLALRKKDSPPTAPPEVPLVTPTGEPIQFLVDRRGVKFTPVSPPENIGPPPAISNDIRVGDTVTFDLTTAGLKIQGVPGGNVIGVVTRAPSGGTLDVRPTDSRLPANLSPVTIPVAAVSGIQPGD